MSVEIPLTGGAINVVTRRGNIVYRTGGPWSTAVLALLGDLQRLGFGYAPAPIGMDDQGREMISFLTGEPMMRPWRAVMFTEPALQQAAAMLRSLHDATRDLAYPAETEWRTGRAAKEPGQVIRHGDLGPWNTLWDGDTLTGLVDWDFAEPGEAITDLAQMALYFVPLRGEAHWQECGFPKRPDFRRRLDVLCEAYGAIAPVQVIGEIERLQRASMAEIESRAAEGRYPWTMFRDNGEIAKTEAEVDWLRREFPD